MDTENLAKMAFQHVRKIYSKGLKSSTKGYRSGPREVSDISRVEMADKHIIKTRKDYITKKIATQSKYYSEFERLKVANCGEMSQIAARFIIQHGGNAGVCVTADMDSHVFCLVGKPLNKLPEYITVGKLDNNLWIVDSWSGICCPTNLFISEFLNKMNKWTALGKAVKFGGSWVKANDPKWIECVLYGYLTPLPVVIK